MKIIVPSDFGTITFRQAEAVEFPYPGEPDRTITVTSTSGRWNPPEHLTPSLPGDFSLPLACVVGPDGLRRIVPNCSFEELIDIGAVIGPALLDDAHHMDDGVDKSYRVMHLVLQYVRGRAFRDKRGMQEHMTRNYRTSRDLYVRPSGRFSGNQHDVLPGDVGLDAEGKGERFSVTRLTDTGRQVACEAGWRNPISKQAIPFGFCEAAKRNPLRLEAEEVPSLVRMALFDIDTSRGTPSTEVADAVEERLLEALERHLDDPCEEFEEWFSGTRSSLVKQIAQQKKKPGGQLEHGEVRQALLHLGWRAYEYVGQCVDVLMKAVKNSMPDPLNREEIQLYEQMYESQPCYGNLPLALLAERASFLNPAIVAIWNDPTNHDHVAVLHRMLAYYADMAPSRRDADRRSKQRCQGGSPAAREASPPEPVNRRNPETGTENSDRGENQHAPKDVGNGLSVQFVENLHSPRSIHNDQFHRVGEYVRDLEQITCDAECERWDYYIQDESEEPITICISCECGLADHKITISELELAAHAKSVLGRRVSETYER